MRTRDHWSATAPLWEHEGPVLSWFVVFEDDAGPAAVARRLAPVLERPFLDPVPPEWLHVTVQGVGPASGITTHTRDRLVRAVETRCAARAPIAARLGRARLIDQGVTADMEPAAPLAALRSLLQDADAEVRGRGAVPDLRTPFWPHVSFAYASADCDSGTLAEDIDALARESTAELTVGAVSLVLLERTPHLYRWDVVARVRLG